MTRRHPGAFDRRRPVFPISSASFDPAPVPVRKHAPRTVFMIYTANVSKKETC